MNLVNLKYVGRKFYKDPFDNAWNPGDTQLVPGDQAAKLLRHPEFIQPSKAKAKEAEPTADAKKELTQDEAGQAAAARAEQVEQERLAEEDRQRTEATKKEARRKKAEQDEERAKENMLLTVESMDKGALEEYARKYDVELDKRGAVTKLRSEVSTLIEQFGVR